MTTKKAVPAGYDDTVGVALNMPRGHMDEIKTKWPRRGVLAAETLQELLDDTEADALVCGFSEFPSRALEPLRKNGVRVSRAPAMIRDRRDSVGNALGWIGDGLRHQDSAGIRGLPFLDRPHGVVNPVQPVRLFKTPHGGPLGVIQVHPPVLGNIEDPSGRATDRAYGQRVRIELIEKVDHAALTMQRAGIPTIVVGDFNKLIERLSGEIARRADVQGVVLYGLEARGGGGTLKTRGTLTDHSGTPWAVARVPYYANPAPGRLSLPRLD